MMALVAAKPGLKPAKGNLELEEDKGNLELEGNHVSPGLADIECHYDADCGEGRRCSYNICF